MQARKKEEFIGTMLGYGMHRLNNHTMKRGGMHLALKQLEEKLNTIKTL